jgi:hypothetical protein
MRHRTTLGLGLLLALAAIVVPTASAATTSFSVTFQEFFGRSVPHPCSPPSYVCGEGVVAGYGSATTTLEITSFTNFDPEEACGDTTLLRTITFANGTLELTETGTVCFPGKAFFTPGASSGHSYGNPVRISTTWTVTGGTGAFAGASGSGTDQVKTAGDVSHSSLSGTLTLP